MKKFLLSSLAFILAVVCMRASYVEIPDNLFSTGLRIVVIETIGGVEPTCEPVVAPPGSWGIGITNADKVPGSVAVVNADGTVAFESGEYVKKESGMTVKVRGNTSALYDKKPFKIKLEKKGDLLGRGDKSLNDKNWVILSSRNNLYELGFIIGELIGMPWAPACEYVHVIFNGDYRGVYLLAEAVERNEKCRIITDEDGFVAEKDAYWWNEGGEYLPSIWNPQFNWTMKYPDFEDLTPEFKAYVQEVLNAYEAVIFTEDYESLIDIDSYCRWLLAQDILGTSDGGGTNFYLAKASASPGSKLFVPVLWDVDSAEETYDAWSNVHGEGMVFPLFDNANPAFRKKYVELYYELSPAIFDAMASLAENLRSGAWDGFNRAVDLNNERWGADNMYYSGHNADDMEWWFPPRKLWLDNAIGRIDQTLGSQCIRPAEEEDHITVFSLSGIKIYSGAENGFTAPERGIYIVKKGSSARKRAF